MLRIVVLLGCLALTGAGCLNAVAQLVGDGGPSDDSGVGCGLGNGDAGICISDAQCPDNYYCDFTVTACPGDAGSANGTRIFTINLGTCLPSCPATGHPTAGGAACHIGEDCAPSEMCIADDGGICTSGEPCEMGACWGIAGGDVLGCADPSCHNVWEPHTAFAFCVCDGNSCIGPDAGPADAGEDAGADAGGPTDAGEDAGSFDPSFPVTYGSTLYMNIASGDLDGDGILDLVAAVHPDQSLEGFDVFLGISDGGLALPTHYAGCDGWGNPAIGDLNGDGLADIVVSYGEGANVFLQPRRWWVRGSGFLRRGQSGHGSRFGGYQR